MLEALGNVHSMPLSMPEAMKVISPTRDTSSPGGRKSPLATAQTEEIIVLGSPKVQKRRKRGN